VPSGSWGQGPGQQPPRRGTPLGVWIALVGVALLVVLGGTCVGLAFWTRGRHVTTTEAEPQPSAAGPASRAQCLRGNNILEGAYFNCTVDEPALSAPFELPMYVSRDARKDPSQANWRCFDKKGMNVELTLSVTSGAARATIVDPAGQTRQVEARPGAAGRLVGPTRCRDDERGGYVRIEPVPAGSTAGGVKVVATVRFP
jgi:hypothetical protein